MLVFHRRTMTRIRTALWKLEGPRDRRPKRCGALGISMPAVRDAIVRWPPLLDCCVVVDATAALTRAATLFVYFKIFFISTVYSLRFFSRIPLLSLLFIRLGFFSGSLFSLMCTVRQGELWGFRYRRPNEPCCRYIHNINVLNRSCRGGLMM